MRRVQTYLLSFCLAATITASPLRAEDVNDGGLRSNPLIGGNPIVFVTRNQYRNEHGTEATMLRQGQPLNYQLWHLHLFL